MLTFGRRLPWAASMPANPPSLGAYVRTLARPVARGLLALHQAQAGLRAQVYQRARDGTLEGDGDPEGAFAFHNWLLDRHLRDEQLRYQVEQDRPNAAGRRIVYAIKPLIGQRWKAADIRAKAHAVNAADGWSLSEDDVNQIVSEQLWWARPARHGGRRHG